MERKIQYLLYTSSSIVNRVNILIHDFNDLTAYFHVTYFDLHTGLDVINTSSVDVTPVCTDLVSVSQVWKALAA